MRTVVLLLAQALADDPVFEDPILHAGLTTVVTPAPFTAEFSAKVLPKPDLVAGVSKDLLETAFEESRMKGTAGKEIANLLIVQKSRAKSALQKEAGKESRRLGVLAATRAAKHVSSRAFTLTKAIVGRKARMACSVVHTRGLQRCILAAQAEFDKTAGKRKDWQKEAVKAVQAKMVPLVEAAAVTESNYLADQQMPQAAYKAAQGVIAAELPTLKRQFRAKMVAMVKAMEKKHAEFWKGKEKAFQTKVKAAATLAVQDEPVKAVKAALTRTAAAAAGPLSLKAVANNLAPSFVKSAKAALVTGVKAAYKKRIAKYTADWEVP
mmetsp:Transcript_56541/g.123957  ORF Transcript_56541/g.123957 Transcript_56541/m.123957 type:complete len:323 (-) Transcript_56541:65-1033(-)